MGRDGDIVHYGKIQFVLQDHPLCLPGVVNTGPDRDLRQRLCQMRQDTRKAGLAQRHVDAEAAGPLGAALPQDLYRFLKLGQHGVRILPQRTPCLCQIDPAVHPLEQPHVVKHLQLPDGQAHRRLCHIQLLRRPGEALLGADGGKDLQMPQRHGTPPYS